MTVIYVKSIAALAIGLLAGLAAVYIFNRMPASWLCDYGQEPSQELKDPYIQRVKGWPWRWVWAGLFACIALRLVFTDIKEVPVGFAGMPRDTALLLSQCQFALAGLMACWAMLIIGLADKKYMIIPDQFVIMLAVAAIGFLPLHRSMGETTASWAGVSSTTASWAGVSATTASWAGASYNSLGAAVNQLFGMKAGLVEPLGGMAIGGGALLIIALLGRAAAGKEVMGFGDVKLGAAMGLALGIEGIIFVLAAGSILSGGSAAVGLARKKFTKDTARPLGPYLCGCGIFYIFIVWPFLL